MGGRSPVGLLRAGSVAAAPALCAVTTSGLSDPAWLRSNSYTRGMTGKVGPKGQVVIPKAIRDRLGIRPGDRVAVEQDGHAVKVTKAAIVSDLIGALPPSKLDPLEVLLTERDADRRREDRLR